MGTPLTIADAAIAITADMKKFKSDLSTGMADAEKTATTAGQRIVKSVDPQALARGLTATGAVAGSLFVGAVGGAATFQDGLATINTVAKLTEDQLADVGDGIIDLSKETGKSTDDLLAGYYDLVSAGVAPADALNVLRDSAKFATGALGTTGEAVDLVTSAMNAYGLGAGDSARVTDIFAKAVADGKVTAAELGSSIANIAPIAASAGVSLEEVSAGYALLTAKGVPAAQAATQMRAAISALLTPNAQLNDLQKETGINFAELAKEKGLAVALEEIRKATHGNADEFAKSLGSIDAYQFALATTGDNADAMAQQIVESSNAAGLAQEQYDEKSKSATEQGKRMAASIKGLALQIGGPFVEGMGPAIVALNQMGGGLNGIFAVSRLVGGGLGAVIGKALPMLVTGIAGFLPALAPVVGTLFAGLGTVATAAIALWPVLLVAAVVAAIIFLVNNPEIVASIMEFVGSVLEWIGHFLEDLPQLLVDVFTGAFNLIAEHLPGILLGLAELILTLPFKILGLQVKMLEFFAGIFTNILGGLAQLIANMVGFILALPGRIVELAPRIGQFFLGIFTSIGQKAATFVGQVASFVLSIPGRIASLAPTVIAFFAGLISNVLGKVTTFVGQVVSFVLSIPGRIIGLAGTLSTFFLGIGTKIASTISTFVGNIVGFFMSIPGRIASLGGRIVSGIINGMASLPGKLANAIASAFRNLRIDIGPFHISGSGISIDLPNISLPSFDVGSNFIPADMIAAVHRGEIIVPKDEADAIRAGRKTLGTGDGAPQAPTGGNTYHIPLTVQGALPVRTIRDITGALIRLGGMGLLPAATASPKYPIRGGSE